MKKDVHFVITIDYIVNTYKDLHIPKPEELVFGLSGHGPWEKVQPIFGGEVQYDASGNYTIIQQAQVPLSDKSSRHIYAVTYVLPKETLPETH